MDINRDKEMWDWQGDYSLQEDVPGSVWNNLSCQEEEDFSYLFDEATPVKACGDLATLAYDVADSATMNKGLEQWQETNSQVKRRRMLQFGTEVLDVLPDVDKSSPFLKSKEREASVEEVIPDMPQWVSVFADDTSVSGSGYEGLESSENWLADCFIDTETHYSPDEMNSSGASDVQVDVTEVCNTQRECVTSTVEVQRPTRIRRNVTLKGRKSYMKTPTKLASSVVYPFAFVKPSGILGAVTLKDINQRILTPPPSKSKQSKEDPPPVYPTSAFSGKPVVGKTKIHTEGGKGSITIMRTKG